MPSIDLAALRIVKVPDAAPPYDCEIHGAGCPALREAAGTESGGLRDTAPAPGGPRDTVPVPGPQAGARGSAPGSASPATAGTAAAWPRQFAQVMVEVLAGVRPLRQVAPWATDRAAAQIRGLLPSFASERRPRIQRVVTSRPATDVVEMTVIVGFGPRTRAVAMRFEHAPARRAAPGLPPRPARWLCTAIEAG